MFEDIFDLLSAGLFVDNSVVHSLDVVQGRTSAEKRTTIVLERDDEKLKVMDVIFFDGINPWYHPWIELVYPYDFKNDYEELEFVYFDSKLEKTMIKLFCNSLPSAGKIFIAYETDNETRKGLMMSIPPVITRLGFLLFMNDCTWFKDWYFPEGGFEGGQKLQGEKSLSSKQKNRQLNRLYQKVGNYISEKEKESSLPFFEKRAVKRGKIVMDSLS
ncbi:MAG: DUF1122 family protein [Candidatus Thermoplasmatota archaeon]|nr:DUF1122 family protein [Candidatus Thermoplasmatota archaeon]